MAKEFVVAREDQYGVLILSQFYLGMRGLQRLGKTKWRQEVASCVSRLLTAFHLHDVVLGGGMDFKGRGKDVQLYHDGVQTMLYAPGPKLYAVIQSAKTLDGMLQELEKRNVYLPAKNLLATDPYQTLVPDLITGYVIGQVQMYDKAVHQLAFTEKDAEYQLWVTGAPDPSIQGLEVISMALAHEPRVMIEFSDWNLNP